MLKAQKYRWAVGCGVRLLRGLRPRVRILCHAGRKSKWIFPDGSGKLQTPLEFKGEWVAPLFAPSHDTGLTCWAGAPFRYRTNASCAAFAKKPDRLMWWVRA